MAMILTQSEDMVSEAERKKQQEILLKQAHEKVQKQFQDLDQEKKSEQLKLQ